MKSTLILCIFLLSSCRPGFEENSKELLRTISVNDLDSINLTVYKSIKYDSTNILGHETIFKKNINSHNIKLIKKDLLVEFLLKLNDKTYTNNEELQEKLIWNREYKIKQIDESVIHRGNKEVIEIFLYIYFKAKSYKRLDLHFTEYGINYEFCCTDYSKFPYNTFKGLGQYSFEYCFDLEMKEIFIELINNLLIEMKESENPLILESI
ncbi:MAG: hypothetical protein CVV25_00640 [Ignavibacteriae bacterium HGW-Ignavibacteriae-4]|jgi:hypothetical protein|nr:MAG: hypothetical protein CVV25_00640 [Ignavibacteriae bacterium HGW-Ignavibacteriae-4]